MGSKFDDLKALSSILQSMKHINKNPGKKINLVLVKILVLGGIWKIETGFLVINVLCIIYG